MELGVLCGTHSEVFQLLHSSPIKLSYSNSLNHEPKPGNSGILPMSLPKYFKSELYPLLSFSEIPQQYWPGQKLQRDEIEKSDHRFHLWEKFGLHHRQPAQRCALLPNNQI